MDSVSTTPDSTTQAAVPDTPQTPPHISVIVQEVKNDPKVGDLTGQCKWWSDKLGYGFITVQNGELKGKDIFVHHSGIKPLNSNYKTLKKGEYINFDVTDGEHGMQAVNVTGIGGGSLICDVNPHIKHVSMHAANGGVSSGGPRAPRMHAQQMHPQMMHPQHMGPPPPPHHQHRPHAHHHHHMMVATPQQYSIPFDQHMMLAGGRGTSRAYHHRPYATPRNTHFKTAAAPPPNAQ